jgi:hypothetical protein
MKKLFVAILFLFLSSMMFAQMSTYQFYWNGVAETTATYTIASYRLYIEERPSPTGFILQQGLDPTTTDISSFFWTEISAQNLPQYIYEMTMNDDGAYMKMGVLVVSTIGQVGKLGSHPTAFQREVPPPDLPIPVGSGIRLK